MTQGVRSVLTDQPNPKVWDKVRPLGPGRPVVAGPRAAVQGTQPSPVPAPALTCSVRNQGGRLTAISWRS